MVRVEDAEIDDRSEALLPLRRQGMRPALFFKQSREIVQVRLKGGHLPGVLRLEVSRFHRMLPPHPEKLMLDLLFLGRDNLQVERHRSLDPAHLPKPRRRSAQHLR